MGTLEMLIRQLDKYRIRIEQLKPLLLEIFVLVKLVLLILSPQKQAACRHSLTFWIRQIKNIIFSTQLMLRLWLITQQTLNPTTDFLSFQRNKRMIRPVCKSWQGTIWQDFQLVRNQKKHSAFQVGCLLTRLCFNPQLSQKLVFTKINLHCQSINLTNGQNKSTGTQSCSY